MKRFTRPRGGDELLRSTVFGNGYGIRNVRPASIEACTVPSHLLNIASRAMSARGHGHFHLDEEQNGMACLLCDAQAVNQALDLGHHPVASFFLPARDTAESAVHLALGQCEACGTIQLMKPVPHEALVPPYDWLFAREPEEHLDEVAERIGALPGVTTSSVIGALTAKDDTTIERFRRKGFERTWRVELEGAMRSHERSQVGLLLASIRLEPVSDPIATVAGELMRRHRRSHPGIDIADYVIAATTELLGAKLLTLKVRHFPMFRGLKPAF